MKRRAGMINTDQFCLLGLRVMPFASVRGLEMFYELRGSGPRVLGLSGTGGDLRRSPTVYEMLLPNAFEILAFDQRGLGQTSRPDIPYSLADYADDAASLLDALGWDTCSVLGFSFGGMVAQEFALRHPDRVERMVLAATTSGGQGGRSYPMHELSDLPLHDRVRQTLMLGDTRRDAAWQSANEVFFESMCHQVLQGLDIGADEPGRQVGEQRQLEARSRHDTYDRLATLTLPTLVCGGVYDGVAKTGAVTAMQQQISGSQLQMFEGGHLFFKQDQHAIQCMSDFLLNGG